MPPSSVADLKSSKRKEGDRKGRGKPLALTKGFSSPLHNTLSTLQFIARLNNQDLRGIAPYTKE